MSYDFRLRQPFKNGFAFLDKQIYMKACSLDLVRQKHEISR